MIKKQRLLDSLAALSQIGRRSEGRGVTRRAFDDAEQAAKQWLKSELDAAQLAWREDGAGNIIARLGEEGSAIATGSHLDTVPDGGDLDGAFGVVAGLEVLRSLKESGVALKRPVELIAFTDEEGRFGSMIGSKCMSGALSKVALESARDEADRSLSDALIARGSSVDKALESRRDPAELDCFIELHIEQGPVLDQRGLELGVVEQVVGIIRWRAKLSGEANHAGTTPMALRRDAFVGLTQLASRLPELLTRYGSESARATIGEVSLSPGYMGVVPAEASFSMDLRDISQPHLDELHAQLQKTAREVAESNGLSLDIEVIGTLEATRCDPQIVEVITHEMQEMGARYCRLPSGATHDALPMAALCPMGMIFVPSVKGISHSPHEYTSPEHLVRGAEALYNTIQTLSLR